VSTYTRIQSPQQVRKHAAGPSACANERRGPPPAGRPDPPFARNLQRTRGPKITISRVADSAGPDVSRVASLLDSPDDAGIGQLGIAAARREAQQLPQLIGFAPLGQAGSTHTGRQASVHRSAFIQCAQGCDASAHPRISARVSLVSRCLCLRCCLSASVCVILRAWNVRVHTDVRACALGCVRACVRACWRASVRKCMCLTARLRAFLHASMCACLQSCLLACASVRA
jgi:hypothetical protein